MVKARLEDGVIVFEMEGEFLAAEFYDELWDWLDNRDDEFVGYIMDVSKITKHPAMEQRKAAAYSKKVVTQKQSAVVGKGENIARLVNIYLRFTKADSIKYFSSQSEAKAWVLSQV